MKKTAFTIIAKNYLSQALTARSSFIEKEGCGYEYKIFIMDMIANIEELKTISALANENIQIFFWGDIKRTIIHTDYEDMITRYDVMEMSTAIKPYIIEHLYNCGYEKVIYFDPDIVFYSSLTNLDSYLDSYDIILTPHMLEPYPDDGLIQNRTIINLAGIYNLGFVATKQTNNSRKMLSFWQACLFKYAYNKPNEGMFTDQIWANWFPALFDNVLILKDKGYNGAYWNLHERMPKRQNNRLTIGDDDLVFYHFSGFNPHNFYNISKHQNRFTLDNVSKEYIEMASNYADKLLSNEFTNFNTYQYFYKKINNACSPKNNGTKFLIFKKMKACFKKNKRKDRSISNLSSTKTVNQLCSPNEEFGYNLYGYFEDNHSIAHIGRMFTTAFNGTGIPYTLINIGQTQQEKEFETYKKYYSDKNNEKKNIIFANLDQIPHIIRIFRKNSQHTTVLPFWEFETGIEKYSNSFEFIDEIFTYTSFTANALKKVIPSHIKITKIPIPFYIDINNRESRQTTRNLYGIPLSDIIFFYNFDFNSSYNRKNPEAILQAFSLTLSGVNDAKIVIKVVNSQNYSLEKEYFWKCVKNLKLEKQIILIDKFISREKFLSLLSSIDCYVSLHRGEGLGLGIMEAMALGKPVIATNYSGNTEFCSSKNCLLVDYNLIPCTDTFPAYSEVKYWAQPNVETAATYMKKIYSDKEFSIQLGESAQKYIQTKFSQQNFIKKIYDNVKASSIV